MVAVAPQAAGQEANAGAAEALFESGKALLVQKDYAQACPKLAESYRLDPGTGTLLALALCHEGQGRLATAWGEFADVAARAHREGRPDREALASKHRADLESRVSKLTISVDTATGQMEAVRITRDGVEVGAGSWATPVPTDPGAHRVEASARGYKPFAVTVVLSGDGSRETVIVPALQPDSTETPGAPDNTPRFWSTPRYVGVALMGAGVVGVVVGSIFGLQAISSNDDSNKNPTTVGCSGTSCGATGFSDRNDARSSGTVSTIAFVAGGALLGGGAVLFALGKPRANLALTVPIVPSVADRSFGLGLRGWLW